MKKKLNNEYLDSFLDNIWAEQGLAKNTLLSYEHDINSFLTFIDKKDKFIKYKAIRFKFIYRP